MTKRKASGICVPLSKAEPLRRYLREHHLLREDLSIKKDEQFIYFPLTEVPNDLGSYKNITAFFEKKETQPHSYKNIVKIPGKLREKLPTSYDIVGDILLIKLPKDLRKYQKEIGRALLKAHRNIRTVCRIDAVTGEMRTRKVTIVAGEKRTQTTHTEYGLSFEVDVRTAYFSPRLASERRRVAALVRPRETIVDMFAGVAPFSVMIARYAKPKIVYAIDKNQAAVRFAQQNVKKNKMLDIVEVIHADAKDAQQVLSIKADRILMNLPFSAHRFFSYALAIAKRRCIVHYYDIIGEEEIQLQIEYLKKIAAKQNYLLTAFSVHKIKTYAAREFYIGIDITATKHADVA